MAISRLMDGNPSAVIEQVIGQVGRKGVKAMQIFELLATTREEAELEKELSKDI